MKHPMLAAAVIAGIAGTQAAVAADDTLNFDDESTRINYSLGYQIGGDFKRQDVEMDTDAVVQGIQDALSDAEPQDVRRRDAQYPDGAEAQGRRRAAQALGGKELEILAEGKKFLEENAAKEGVVTTESGLQYKILEEGTGKSPGPEDQVTVHYRGSLIDGMEFDSSHKRGKPATFRLNGVIKGWSEGLQLMKEGGKAELYIPQNLAYGGRGPLAHRTLIFDVELISVGDEAPAPAEAKEGEQK